MNPAPDGAMVPGLPPLPPLMRNGRPDFAYFQALARRGMAIFDYCASNMISPAVQPAQYQKFIADAAEMHGFSAKRLHDFRSPEDKLLDFCDTMMGPGGAEELWKVADDTLELALDAMRKSVEHTASVIESSRMDPGAKSENDQLIAKLDRGKAWVRRIEAVMRLRQWARHPIPEGITHEYERHAWEASHPLRFMIYVGRSSKVHKDSEQDRHGIFQIGRLHGVMAARTWEAWHGVAYTHRGVVKGGASYAGVVLIFPPRHGKTEFAAHWLASRIAQQTMTQSLYLHAQEEVAARVKQYIASSFDGETRLRALYPHLRLARDNNNATSMRLDLPERPKSPTLTAAGVGANKLGIDTNIQVWDDVVTSADAESSSERDRTDSRLRTVWLSRQSGKSFLMVIGQILHQDDALARLLNDAKRSGQYVVSINGVGGPSTNPPFRSIWPEAFPPSELRKLYLRINNPRLWAASYMAQPANDETQVIRKLRYYDHLSDEHQAFLRSAVFHVSIDPSATNKSSSDKAGIVYAASGTVGIRRADGIYEMVPRLRILSAKQFHATQSELVNHVASFALQRRVDYVYVETRGGYIATKEMFAERFGIDAIEIDPGPRSKESRLRACAPAIDDSIVIGQQSTAVVEFPGIVGKDGSVVCDSEFRWLEEQITQFPFHADDHCVDAVTQLVNYLVAAGELPLSGSSFSVGQVGAAILGSNGAVRSSRLSRLYDSMRESTPTNGDGNDEDVQWFTRRL